MYSYTRDRTRTWVVRAAQEPVGNKRQHEFGVAVLREATPRKAPPPSSFERSGASSSSSLSESSSRPDSCSCLSAFLELGSRAPLHLERASPPLGEVCPAVSVESAQDGVRSLVWKTFPALGELSPPHKHASRRGVKRGMC